MCGWDNPRIQRVWNLINPDSGLAMNLFSVRFLVPLAGEYNGCNW